MYGFLYPQGVSIDDASFAMHPQCAGSERSSDLPKTTLAGVDYGDNQIKLVTDTLVIRFS
jgi:hypothetical protein